MEHFASYLSPGFSKFHFILFNKGWAEKRKWRCVPKMVIIVFLCTHAHVNSIQSIQFQPDPYSHHCSKYRPWKRGQNWCGPQGYLFGYLKCAHPAHRGRDGGNGEVGGAGYLRFPLLDPHHHHNVKDCNQSIKVKVLNSVVDPNKLNFWIRIQHFDPIWIRIQGYVINVAQKKITFFLEKYPYGTIFLKNNLFFNYKSHGGGGLKAYRQSSVGKAQLRRGYQAGLTFATLA